MSSLNFAALSCEQNFPGEQLEDSNPKVPPSQCTNVFLNSTSTIFSKDTLNNSVNISSEASTRDAPSDANETPGGKGVGSEGPRQTEHDTRVEAVSGSISLPSHLTLINLKEEYNFSLLEDFYYRIMKPNFPLEEELDSLENFDRNLQSDSFLETEIAVLFDETTQLVAAGVIYDYYSVSNVGLLSYFCVDQRDAKYRGMGLGKFLVQYAYQRCQEMARTFNKSKEGRNFRKLMLKQLFHHDATTLASLQKIFKRKYFLHDSSKNDMFAFFAETNKLGVHDGVLESNVRHRILNSIGFRFLDFEYVQAPLYETVGPCYDLILLAYKASVHPNYEQIFSVRREIILAFLTETAYSVMESKPFDYRDESYFKHLEAKLRSGPQKYELLDLPWTLGQSKSKPLKCMKSQHFANHMSLDKIN